MPYENNYLSVKLPNDLKLKLKKIIDQISQKDPRFKSTSLEYLHMTLLFFGQKLKHLKESELHQLEEKLESILSDHFTLLFIKPVLKRFPPEKLNLYVIKYSVSPDGHQLYAKLNVVLQKYLDGVAYQNWAPHITLGKLHDYSINMDSQLDSSYNWKAESIMISGSSRKIKIEFNLI